MPFWIIIMFASLSLLSSIPKLLIGVSHGFYHTLDSLVVSEISFIQTHKGNNKECLILSQRQGPYYLEMRLVSPIQGPGLSEMLLKSDLDDMQHQLLNHPVNCIFYGVGLHSAPLVNVDLTELLLRYRIKAKNPEGSMLLLVPKG